MGGLPGRYDVDKIFDQSKPKIDQYLGEPISCKALIDTLFCEYDWLGTIIYFDKTHKMPRTVTVTELPSLKFRTKATREIGLKIKSKPTFRNEFVIKWDFFDGKEVSIFSATNDLTKVSSISIKAVPLTISHTESSGLPISAVVSLALEYLYEELNKRDHNDVVIFNLYMDGLIDEYGNKIEPRLIHSYKLGMQDTENLRRYKNEDLFHSERNKFHVRFGDELASHPWVIRFWSKKSL